MNLLLDFGNTRCKWALEEDGAIVRSGVFNGAGEALWDQALWSRELGREMAMERVLVASVRCAKKNSKAYGFLAALYNLVPEFVKVQKEFLGLSVAYDDVGTMGVDRWLAMLGAWRQFSCACLVVDAGSALTVDSVASSGEHRGGLIVPGLAMMQQSLFTSTAAVKVPRLSVPSPWSLGKDTLACVENGVSALLLGFLEEVVAKQMEAQQKVIFTGGDAPKLQALYPRHAELAPNLVLEGLICLL